MMISEQFKILLTHRGTSYTSHKVGLLWEQCDEESQKTLGMEMKWEAREVYTVFWWRNPLENDHL
jgi:hypothetical protein